jgi:hypothetical protein
MRERKNIERLFQEKFKDFEATPNPLVWENIACKLESKQHKKRGVLPFWYKTAGVAAILLIGFFTVDNFTSLFGSSAKAPTETVVVKQDVNEEQEHKENNNTDQIVTSKAANRLVDSKISESESIVKNNKGIDGNNNRLSKQKSDNSLIVTSDKSRIKNNTLSKEKDIELNSNSSKSIRNRYSKTSLKNEDIVDVSDSRKESADSKSKRIVSDTKEDLASSVSKNKTVKNKYRTVVSKNNAIVSGSNRFNAINKKAKMAVSNTKEVVVSNADENSIVENKERRPFVQKNDVATKVASAKGAQDKTTKGLVQQEYKSQSSIAKNKDDDMLASERKKLKEKEAFIDKFSESAITAVLPQKDKAIEKSMIVDSLAIAKTDENPLEKILREKESKAQDAKVVTQRLGKWKIKPNVAPIIARSSQGGSPIAGEFADNSKDYENSLGVGLGLDYAISNKVSIRTGLNKFNLGYNTNDIAYYADLNANAKNVNNGVSKTVNLAPQSRNIVIEDKYKAAAPNSAQLQANQSAELAFQGKNDGYLNQEMGYLEVPLEISYALSDKKFGVQIFTGVSTLFLNENKISVVSSGLTTVIGEASNLNKVHFSTNIGVGFKYSFWKSFEANFEPTFKYQVNTFNANSGGFRPYLIGLYSGISFKF